MQWDGLLAALLAQEKAAGVEWQTEVVAVADTAVLARGTAILAYVSQVSTFFADESDLRAQVAAYVTAVGGERLWQPTQA